MAEDQKVERATFAGGCFWCMVHPFDTWPGVLKVVSGYTGGTTEHPTYAEVCAGGTGHREAVEVTFDPVQVSYADLVERFWREIDPTDAGGQFFDRGESYQTAIFYHDDVQRQVAEASRENIDASRRFSRPVVTEILPAGRFWPAESYHQDYYKTNAAHYERYRAGSGRERFIREHWVASPSRP
jgi:methionine-S-sulfoxide reductase